MYPSIVIRGKIRPAKGNNGSQKETGLHLHNRSITAKLRLYSSKTESRKRCSQTDTGKEELRESDSSPAVRMLTVQSDGRADRSTAVTREDELTGSK